MDRPLPREINRRALGGFLRGLGTLLEDPSKKAEFQERAKEATRDAIHRGIDVIGVAPEIAEAMHTAVDDGAERYRQREAKK
jgi:hypothetical protein